MTTKEITVSGSTVDFNNHSSFHGSNFKRWQQKMLFFLTMKKVAYVMKDDKPVIPSSSIPSGLNSNGQASMDTYTSDPTKKDELEKHTAEHAEKVKLANINIALLKENDYLCKNFILNGLGDNLYDLDGIYDTAKQVWRHSRASMTLKKLDRNLLLSADTRTIK